MSATSFNRMRRINALHAELESKGIDFDSFKWDETALREAATAPDAPKEEVPFSDEPDEATIRARAKELGIKSWHIKSIDTLTAEIAEKEGQ
jgi:hypothetical protein